MKPVALTLALITLVACAKAGSNDTAASDSGVTGRVVLGPQCPVVAIDNPCGDRPYQADIQVVDRTGDVVTTTRSGPNGRFTVRLDPGGYVLKPLSPTPDNYPFGKDVSVSVRPHHYTRVTVFFDTGIR